MKVYDSPGESGNSVCFYGNGYVDFSAIPYPGIGQNWNDRASSYGAHGYSGRFYMNVGETGSHWDFYAGTSSNFGGVWDNTVSSMCIASGPTSCPGY